MNKLEIFQEVYGKDYAFTETELSRLLKVTELIVRECANLPFKDTGEVTSVGEIAVTNMILNHFGVAE